MQLMGKKQSREEMIYEGMDQSEREAVAEIEKIKD